MRVLMSVDSVGGVWTYALDLARALKPLGIEVTLAVLGPSPSADQRAEADEAAISLIDTHLPLDWAAADRAAVLAAGSHVAALARALNVDLVQLNSPALAVGRDFDRPVVGVCHSCLATWWAAAEGGEPPADFRWRTDLLAKGYAACDALIAPSAAFAEATRRLYGLRPRVVHNGRAAATLAPPGQRGHTVLTAGRLWDRGKGLATLEAAAPLVRAPVLAAGPLGGPNGETVVLRAVQPLGRLEADAVRRRLAEARIFVSTAIYEPFGLAVLEAAQAGCALVLTDIPTFRELWDGAAVFTPPGDAAALAAALNGLVDDDAAATGRGLAAARRAQAYRPEAMAQATAGIYRAAFATGPSREAAA